MPILPMPPGFAQGDALDGGALASGTIGQLAQPATALSLPDETGPREGCELLGFYFPFCVRPIFGGPAPSVAHVGFQAFINQDMVWAASEDLPLVLFSSNTSYASGNGTVSSDLFNPIDMPPAGLITLNYFMAFDEAVTTWELGIAATIPVPGVSGIVPSPGIIRYTIDPQ